MAKITQGILGPVSGKVGNVVGGSWKGVDYVRGYIIPANPKTSLQTENRDKFAEIVRLSKAMLSSLLRSYYADIIAGLPTTAFAKNIAYNQKQMTSATDYENFSLMPQNQCWVSDIDASYDAGTVTVSWVDEDTSYKDAIPVLAFVAPSQTCPVRVITTTAKIEDETEFVLVDWLPKSTKFYPILCFKYTEAATGVITWSGATNLGEFTTPAA